MHRPHIAVLLLALLAAACSKKEGDLLRLAEPVPRGVVQRTAPLIFVFSGAVVPPESTNQWTGMPYVQFTPDIPGTFTWRDSATLVFSPDGALAGDTKYRAKLNAGLLLKLSGKKAFGGAEEVVFSTEAFALRRAEFFYDRVGQSRTVGIRANLEFTYAVSPAEVARRITVTIDNQPHEVKAVTTEASSVIPLEIGTTLQLEKPKHIAVTFAPDLVSSETNTRITAGEPFTAELAGLEEMKIYGHDVGSDGTSGWLTLRTSQEVDVASAKPFITLNPPADFTLTGDGRSLTLRGKFAPGSTLRVTVRKGLESVLGGKTQNDYEADIVFGNVTPSFGFTSPGGVYMLLGGRRALELKTINLDRLAVRVSQVFLNNLVFFLEAGRSYDYGYEDEGEGGGSYVRKFRYFLGNYGRRLSYDTLAVRNVANREITTLFDMQRFLNNGYKGFYLVEIGNPSEAWRTTSKLVSVSNIGLIVKRSTHQVLVFATNLETTRPLSGATITLVSTSNQVIASAHTDGDGLARFDGYEKLKKDFELKLVTAESGDDFNFLSLEDERVETSRFPVDGKYDSESGYDALLYGDRNLYRPGERMILSGIVRELHRALPERFPVRLKIYNPRGTLVSETQHQLNEEGSFETSFQTLAASPTGSYRVELYTGNGMYLADYTVSVEDFVPDRLRVSLTASKDTARPGDKLRYEAAAVNFFGPPAAGRDWEFEGSVSMIPYVSKSFPEFRFSDEAAADYTANPEVFTGKTDAAGKASIDLTIPSGVTSRGLARVRGRIAVFDESHRPVYQVAQTIVHPKEYHIGMRNQGPYYVPPNTPQKVELVAVDTHDRPLAGFRARVDLIRFEWQTVLRQAPGTNALRYVSERREISVSSTPLQLGAGATGYTYTVPRSGDYVLRVAKEGDTGYNQIHFYSYDWSTADITSFPVDPEAHVQMVLDKKIYREGDRAHVLFQAPFDGTMLVTVERNGVLDYRYLTVANNAASTDIAVGGDYVPNVYIAAVLFRNIKDLSIPLMAGHGFTPLLVESRPNELEVVITAPDKIRSKRRQSVAVAVANAPGAYVTVAAVDEGILQLKNYKTPDPYAYFYAKKALQTETFDFFRHLLPEPEKSRVGGSEAAMAKRVSPIGVQRFKPVAFWSGIIRTDGSGAATVTIDIPEFNGELRLMAFAYRGDRFGAAERAMKVADPIIVTPALPRFLSPGDTVSMTLTAFNTTDKPASLTFDISTGGGITLAGKVPALQVGANQERFVAVTLLAGREAGAASVRVKTAAFGETFEATTEIPVRPLAPYSSASLTGAVDGGDSATQSVADNYLRAGRSAYLALSPYPVANFAKQLKFLVGYPHGCLEQTVSRAFPQIYLRDMAAILDPTILNHGSPTYFVNEAIAKVTSMQQGDGTFSYWPGGGTSNPWTNVYAAHFLLEAKKAGYAVPENVLAGALKAIAGYARSRQTEDYRWMVANRVVVRRIASKSSLYALYVVALAGKPESNLMNYYRVERSLLTGDTQVLLAGAFALSGDRRAFLELLPAEFPAEESKRESGGNFDSPLRAKAISLNVLYDTDLNSASIPRYLDYLSHAYANNPWSSTQDNAFTLLALGKAARLAAPVRSTGTVTVGTKSYAYTGGTQKIGIDPFGTDVRMKFAGEGRVFYSLVTEGIRTDGKVNIEDRGLQIRREFFNRFGAPVSLGGVKQNDLVVVKLTLAASVERLENIAISDLLPAGFEVENPRLTEETGYAFIKNASVPDYIDIRDDRINFYTGLPTPGRPAVFYYMVRAVTPGDFGYAPVVAEAMYDANFYSASGQGRLHVSR